MRSLPFKQRATLIDKPNTTVASDVPVSVWPTRSTTTRAGTTYDAIGEAHVDYADELAVANRVLRVDGADYVVVSATPHDFIPHVELRLRRTVGAGS